MTAEFEATLHALQGADAGADSLDGLMNVYVDWERIGRSGGAGGSPDALPKFTQNMDDALLAVPAGMLCRLEARLDFWSVAITDQHGRTFSGWHPNPRLATCLAAVRAFHSIEAFANSGSDDPDASIWAPLDDNSLT
jgi:hypothetical protein